MAPSILSEEQRTQQNEMAHASAEIAANFREVALRLEGVRRAEAIADYCRKISSLYVRMQQEAASERAIDEVSFRTLSRVYQDVSIKLQELVELVNELVDEQHPVALSVAIQHASTKVARLDQLTTNAVRVLDLRLS